MAESSNSLSTGMEYISNNHRTQHNRLPPATAFVEDTAGSNGELDQTGVETLAAAAAAPERAVAAALIKSTHAALPAAGTPDALQAQEDGSEDFATAKDREQVEGRGKEKAKQPTTSWPVRQTR